MIFMDENLERRDNSDQNNGPEQSGESGQAGGPGQNPLYLRAMQLYNRHQYEQAAKEFREALKVDPEHLPSHQYLAMTLSLLKKHQQAEQEIAFVLQREPNDEHAIYIAALIKYNEGKYPDALKLNKQVLALDPDYAEAHLLEGRVAFHKKNWKLAKAQCLRAIECDPELIISYVILAKTLHQLKETKLAIETLRTVLSLSPDDSDSHALLGLLLLDQGDRKGAQEHLREALRLNPNSEPAIEGFIECLRNRNILYFWFMTGVFALTSGPLRFFLWLRVLAPQLLGLYLLFFLFVWGVKQFVNFSLQLDPEVRRYLPPEFKKRNRIYISLIVGSMTVLYGASLVGAHRLAEEEKEIKNIVSSAHTKEGDAKMDAKYEEAMSGFLIDKHFYIDDDLLENLKQYEKDKPNPSQERLAYLALWTGMRKRGSLKDRAECAYFEETMKIAKELKNQRLYDYAFAQLAYSVYPALPAPGPPKWKDEAGKDIANLKYPKRSFDWLETSTICRFLAEAKPSEALDLYAMPVFEDDLKDYFTDGKKIYGVKDLEGLLAYELRRKPVNDIRVALINLFIARNESKNTEGQKQYCIANVNEARARAKKYNYKTFDAYCDTYIDFINGKRKDEPSKEALEKELSTI